MCPKVEGKCKQSDHGMEPQDEAVDKQRLMQLSGFMVEVLDQDEDIEVPSLPFSFQVNTYKMHLKPDGSSSSTLNDSLILSAVDEEAKKSWVKSIKYWNRYGWRETTQVAATRRDLEKLYRVLQHDMNVPRERHSLGLLESSGATRRQPKRRFYRATLPSSLAPPP
ncbi:hypothetical protein PsorP6_011722 [Peronosclerospora sorghi]|uniref:Uncharacterized protein n=1 Tax=Peronosclerospora sorghi TaxID=230839 RepID=A0ACC0WHL3_9STRA|nr:hypothetical protein PsorP6_011722 [Peronosclerospora sorghi]